MERKAYSQVKETKRTVISTGNHGYNSQRWEQVVYKTPNGKTVKGKPAFTSATKHERLA